MASPVQALDYKSKSWKYDSLNIDSSNTCAVKNIMGESKGSPMKVQLDLKSQARYAANHPLSQDALARSGQIVTAYLGRR